VSASKKGLTFYQISLAPGSKFAMQFTNVDSRYVAPADLSLGLANFGMEVYVQMRSSVTEAQFFYNGGPDFAPFGPLNLPRGYGLGVAEGQYAALIANRSPFLTGVPANPLEPVEMALVNGEMDKWQCHS
jgi:hypothetical protein